MFYALCLLVGSLLFAVAGLNHPMLTGDGAAQLATVAATPAWRTIHWALLFGLPLMYTGLVGVTLRHADTAGSAPARAGAFVTAFAFSVWAVNIMFMAGAGWHLARAYAQADTGLAGTRAVFLYDMLHPAGLVAERLTTFALGLVAYLYGRALLAGGVYPRGLAWAGFVVAAACAAVGLAFNENAPQLYYAQGVFVTWLFATALVPLVWRRASTT